MQWLSACSLHMQGPSFFPSLPVPFGKKNLLCRCIAEHHVPNRGGSCSACVLKDIFQM